VVPSDNKSAFLERNYSRGQSFFFLRASAPSARSAAAAVPGHDAVHELDIALSTQAACIAGNIPSGVYASAIGHGVNPRRFISIKCAVSYICNFCQFAREFSNPEVKAAGMFAPSRGCAIWTHIIIFLVHELQEKKDSY
jgi:hypothetical protein